MSYKVTEEGNISTVHLDGEIDMDVNEKAKEIIKKGVDSALDFFELDINVNVNPVVSFKV